MPGEFGLKNVSPGEPVSATQWNNLVRLVRSIIAQPGLFVDSTGAYQRRLRTVATATAAATVRWGILRTVLNPGASCIIEECTYQTDGSLQCSGLTFRAWRPLGDFYGISDEAGVSWIVEPDGPDAEQLDALGISLPESAPEPTETDIASLQSITCVGFVFDCTPDGT